MIATGDPIVPHLNGAPYAHKPPLYFWAIAALRLLGFGWTPAAVIPGLTGFLVTLALVPALARAFGMSRDEGLAGVVVLASTPFASGFALMARMDMMLVASHTAAVLALARIGSFGSAPRARWHWVFWLAVAFGVLTKGPIAIALALVTAAAWAVFLRSWRLLREVLVGPGPLACLGLVLAWLVPAGLQGGQAYLEELLVHQSVGRVVESFAHRRPFYYYLLTYPLVALPWTPIALAALFRALRTRSDRAAVLPALALTGGVVLLSLISGKIVIYLLPLFPLAALLAARSLLDGGSRSRWMSAAVAAGVVALGLLGAVAPLVRKEFVDAGPLTPVAGAVMALAGLWVAGRAVLAKASLREAACAGLLFPALVAPTLLAAADGGMTLAETGRLVAHIEPEEEHVLTLNLAYYGIPLYAERTARPLSTLGAAQAALASGRTVVARRREWETMKREDGLPVIEEFVPAFAREPLVVLRPRTTAPAAMGADLQRQRGGSRSSISRQTSRAPVAP